MKGFLGDLGKSSFRWLMYLKANYHNEKRKRDLESQGYTFIDINNFNKLRELNENVVDNFEWDKEYDLHQYHQQNKQILKTTKPTRKRRFSQMSNDDSSSFHKVKRRRMKIK